jgi:acetylornithine deacetylase/succinyl-diaminopimelate desuccinylase-like protein
LFILIYEAYILGFKLLKDVEQEITTILRKLIRINTVNPPGNELEAATYLNDILSSEGFDCEIINSAPERANLITRLSGKEGKPSLLLLSHLDVVGANKKEWSVDPFEGIIKDGYVWGRGALDMKSMTAIETMVLILLKRNNVALRGNLILAATADEEKGGLNGVNYLMENYRDKISADYVINEGGGVGIFINNKTLFTIQNAEKGIIWFRVKTKGIPGHGSMPDKNNSAILLMNKVIDKLVNYTPQSFLDKSLKLFLEKLSETDLQLKEAISNISNNIQHIDVGLEEISKLYPDLAKELLPRIKMTITPTIIKGGFKENVIPSECETTFDCRILPGQSSDSILKVIRQLLNSIDPENIEMEILQIQDPTVSKVNTSLYNTIESVLRDFSPVSISSPLLMTGGTDSRFFRKRGKICYGFQPRLPEKPYHRIVKSEHGIDERISINNLVFGVSILYEVVKRFLS